MFNYDKKKTILHSDGLEIYNKAVVYN